MNSEKWNERNVNMEENKGISACVKVGGIALYCLFMMGATLTYIAISDRPPSYAEVQQQLKEERVEYIKAKMKEGYSIKIGDADIDVLPSNILRYELAESTENKIIYLLD